jgi:hypothetical protein
VWVPRGEGEGGPGEQQWAAAVGLFADAADVEVPVLPPGEIAESFLRFVHYQADDAVALLLLLAVLGLVVERVVPFLVGNALPIGAGLAALAAVVLADRLTRPWFIEAESGASAGGGGPGGRSGSWSTPSPRGGSTAGTG